MDCRISFQLKMLLLVPAIFVLCCGDESGDRETGWQLLQGMVVPYAGNYRAMAFDSDRQVLVLHGGNAIADTWEFDGRSWREIETMASPPRLRESAACYASDHRKMFIFGGFDVATEQVTNALWGYDGETWHEYEMEIRPLARQQAAMCYDEHRKRLVLFGGAADSAESHITWEWDGMKWIPNMTEHYPVSCSWQRMVYDSIRRRVVLFGGKKSTTVYQDTWVYDGQDWTVLDIPNPPQKRYDHGMAFDTYSGDVLLVGGFYIGGVMKDFWRFDGQTWRNVVSFPEETLCENPFIAAPRVGSDFWLFSSHWDSNKAKSYTIIYYLKDEGLEVISMPDSPKPIELPGFLTFDTVSRRFLYLVTKDSTLETGHIRSGTWWYSADGWSRTSSPVIDTPYLWWIEPIAMVHDMRRKVMVMIPRQVQPPETKGNMPFVLFEFQNDVWRTREFPDGPKLRSGFRIVYDEKREKIVLFGGRLSNAYYYSYTSLTNDTWEYDGESWRLVPMVRSPAPREDVSMAFDSRRGVIVMHGGLASYYAGEFCDTWELDGNIWRLLPTRHVPRAPYTMVYDNDNDRMLLFTCFNTHDYHRKPIEIWQYVRDDWTLLTFDDGPTQRWNAAVAVDTANHRIVLAGGEYRSVFDNPYDDFYMTDIWELRP